MAAAAEIKEGFLCPVCHKDLRSVNNLLVHFEELHSEQQDLLRSFKDLMGKAKKKILKLDEQEIESFKNEITEDCLPLYSEVQEPGMTRSHTDYFKTVRRDRLDHRTSETNKLIIRLDRLLNLWYYGADRKQHEQELVSWLDGTTVTRCPSCTSSFNLTRRQHHCRLCGSIMCNSCSYFLSYETAQTLVAPVYNTDTSSREKPSKAESETLRICEHCGVMLEHRRRAQFDQMVQPRLCQLYSLLRKLRAQIEPAVERYLKMYNSLMSGDTTFQLDEAQSLRSSIAKQAESLDTLSKKISTSPVDEQTPKLAVLQNNIRRATTQYIKDCLVTLPALPNAADLEKIRRQRTLRYQEQAVAESPRTRTKVKKVTVETGWSPQNVVSTNSEQVSDDPLVEQMNRVRGYIEQAKLDKRFEEVVSLQENLRMLEAYRSESHGKRICD